MKEQDKYYTPTIEEFYIGFEYEVKQGFTDGTVKTQEDFDEAIWRKEVIELGGDLVYINRALNGRNAEKGLSGIRVKYLDKEDIESLGWIHKESGNKPHYYTLPSPKDIYRLYWFEGGLVVSIDNTITEKYSFRGIIKNKSELIKLMKQLDI